MKVTMEIEGLPFPHSDRGGAWSRRGFDSIAGCQEDGILLSRRPRPQEGQGGLCRGDAAWDQAVPAVRDSNREQGLFGDAGDAGVLKPTGRGRRSNIGKEIKP